ncbi:MAG: 1-acyl-sn-glycerol-3-phosphate acyltransferase [Nanoarchaeota archaeon]
MPKILSRIEDYFPYIRHRRNVKKTSPGIRFYKRVSSWIFSKVNVEGIEDVITYARQKPESNIIFVANHLSEFDWAEVQYLLVEHDLEAIVQAGANLFIGPLDPLLRQAGGFKVFREETQVYDENWILNIVKGFIEGDLGIDLGSRVDISKDLSEKIYKAFLGKSFKEGYHLFTLPGYKRQDGMLKYGRSYEGLFLPFSPLVLQVPVFFQKTHPDRELAFSTIYISYERPPEDQNFSRLERMKKGSISRKFVYIEDYLYNLTFRITQRASRVHLSFGDPLPIEELRARGLTRRKQLADYLHKETGKLAVPFPTQQAGYCLDPITANDHMSIYALSQRMKNLRETLQEKGQRYVQYLPEDVTSSLEQAHTQFWQPPTRKIARFDGPKVRVYRPDVMAQYANHCRHLLEE